MVDGCSAISLPGKGRKKLTWVLLKSLTSKKNYGESSPALSFSHQKNLARAKDQIHTA